MYPGDEQTHNQNSMPGPPQPFTYHQPSNAAPTPPPKKPKPETAVWLPWAICGFLLLLVIVFAILLLANNKKETPAVTDKTQQQTQTDQTDENACSNKQRRYKNEDLGFGFCYPNAWGNVTVTDAKFDPSDSGTRRKLGFSEKSQIHLGIVSDDWSSDSSHVAACDDPAVQAFPDPSTFSANWVTVGTGAAITSAIRGLEIVPNEYVVQEQVDSTVNKGDCMQGYKIINAPVYRTVAASYYKPFDTTTTTPSAHITFPTKLIDATDRSDFISFVKSIYKL